MVKLFSNEHVYEHPWPLVTQAFWRKYPNQHYPHVQAVDCFARKLTKDGVFVTHRLITGKVSVPSWMSFLPIPSTTMVVEESRVDPINQILTLRTRNITGSQLLTVQETCVYKTHAEDSSKTFYRQEALITAFAPMVTAKIEQHTFSSFTAQAEKGLMVIENLCQELRDSIEVPAAAATGSLLAKAIEVTDILTATNKQ
eukprot:TRINITY_DN13766_c0_g1_i1.p1 TRINITY_DN13766_c0_g1~~TRINITY_DN13766_c0_g1_i1.p1  ORF type:complete len:199 (-),score=21.54 TRINITY_DN13766_c0_g1_i1:40-636(-)